MLFIVDKQKYSLTNAYERGLDTGNKNSLYLPIVSLSCVQKGVSYSGVRALIALQAICRVIEMTGKDSKTSYTDALLVILFIQLQTC